jgi:hypothetical protein
MHPGRVSSTSQEAFAVSLVGGIGVTMRSKYQVFSSVLRKANEMTTVLCCSFRTRWSVVNRDGVHFPDKWIKGVKSRTHLIRQRHLQAGLTRCGVTSRICR